MASSSLVGGVAVALAFAAMLFIAYALSAAFLDARARERMSAMDKGGAGARFLARVLRNGIPSVKPVARMCLRSERIRTMVRDACFFMECKGFLTSSDAVMSVVLVGSVPVVAICGVVTSSIFGGIAVLVCLLALGVSVTRSFQEKRRNAMREAIPDALRSMGVCFQSGFSLLQTFDQVSSDVQGDLKPLFARGSHILQTGGTATEALSALGREGEVPELAFVAVALDVQHQSGGSIKQVLDAAREMVESELELARTLRVQTAQARLSARVVSVMPFILLALFSFMSPGFLDPFFASSAGVALLVLALGMQLAGIMLVRRMLKVGE